MASDDEPSTDETVIVASNRQGPPDLRILHYNDVYHVEQVFTPLSVLNPRPGSAEPVGGVARFQTLCNYYRNDTRFEGQADLITLFSGDAFNPSLESSVTKVIWYPCLMPLEQTVYALVYDGSQSARSLTIGAPKQNHDLDFGVPQFRHLSSQCNFPWLLANVLDPALGPSTSLGGCPKTLLLTSSTGVKVGLIGLVEREWLDTINSLPPNLIYKSASATAKELVPELRAQGAEIVIAITHQREPNDNKLAERTPAGLIDLVLGGHDHFYQHSFINGTHILRSGSDFKQLSYIETRRKQDGSQGWDFDIRRRDIVRSIPEDPKTVKLVESLTSSLKAKLEKPIGYTWAPLDARFTTVRLRESNLGNFVADLMRLYYGADCCIMAAGTIRGDQIYPPGVLRLRDMLNCFPFEDPVVVLKVTGKAIWEALDNAVGKWPALEGRFPQVSNIEFEFDPRKNEGERVNWVKIGNENIDLNKRYVLATRGYMGRGKDGYTSLLIQSEGGEAEEIVSEENGVLISMILRQYFMSLKTLGRWRRWAPDMDRHWSKVDDDLHSHHPVREPSRSPESAARKASPNQASSSAGNSAAQSASQSNGGADPPKKDTKPSETSPLKPLPSPMDTPAIQPAQQHRAKQQSAIPLSDSEDDPTEPSPVATDLRETEHQMAVIRKVMRKWWRLAGLKGQPKMMDVDNEGEFVIPWTKGIAPRLEGRIRRVGQ